MRKDMPQLLVERPRIGSRKPNNKTRLRVSDPEAWDDDEIPPPRTASADAKELNDLLGPLRRFLRSNCGRPWNNVYSEICQQTSGDSALGAHLLQHVRREVELSVFLVGRVPYLFYSGRQYTGLYVHPKTGILCFRAVPRRKPTQPRLIDAVHWCKHLWFRLETPRKAASCGCNSFRDLSWGDASPCWPPGNWAIGRLVCIHGNEPVQQKNWYLVEYAAERVPGQPDPAVIRKKVPNRKELAVLFDLLQRKEKEAK